MNFKTTYILFGVLALILIGLTITLYMGPSVADDNKFVFPSLNDAKAKAAPDEVDRIEIVRTSPEEKLTFVRDAGTTRWKLNGHRANSDAINNLITHIYEAKKADAESPRSLADWGLEKPEAVVTLHRGDKPELKLSVGKVSPGDESSAVIYVLSSDRPKDPLAVPKSQLEIVLKDVATFRERELVARNTTDLQSVDLAVEKESGTPAIGLEKTSSGGWRYTAPAQFKGGAAEMEGNPATEENKAPTNVRALLADLANIKVEGEDFVADGVKDDDLGKYNLGPKDEKLFLTFKRSEEDGKKTEQTLLVGIGKKAENKGDDKTEKYYACIKGENSVVRIASKSIAPLRKLVETPDALRDKHLVKTEGTKTPDAIVIRNANTFETKDGKKIEKPIEFFKAPIPGLPAGHGLAGSWKMYRGDEALDVQESLVTQLDSLLRDASVETFPDKSVKEADLGVADESKAEAVVEVWVGGLATDEKKDGDKKEDAKAKPKLKDPNKPTVKLIFGIKGPNKTVAVKRIAEGEAPTLLWVKDIVFEKVSAKPLAFLSTTLPTFADMTDPGRNPFKDVTRLQMTRDGKDMVVVREVGKDDKVTWKIEKPEELKGRKADANAVTETVGRLAMLHAVSLEAESATPDALDTIYGLGKSAPVKATVTVVKKVKDKDKEKEETTNYDFAFGKPKGDKEQYAKQSQRGMIFTVNKSDVDLLPKELLDTTIFAFSPSKVKSIKMVGWKSVNGVATTVELENKDGQWTVKTPAGPKANPVTVASLTALSNLKAANFVAHNVKTIDAAYELDVAKDALSITVTVEGEEKPFELTVGKLDADKGYYAISPQAKGDVFYVSKADFEGPKAKPGHFFGQ